MSASIFENLYLTNMIGDNAWLPWMWPVVSLSMWYFDPFAVEGALVGTAVFLAGELVNLWKHFGKEGFGSFPEILLAEVPGVLSAVAAWMVADEYLFPDYPVLSALLAGFVGYEGFIQTCERQSSGPNPSVLAKSTFWMFSLASLATIYLVLAE